MSGEAESAARSFSFAAIQIGEFFMGAFFVALNGPLIAAIVSDQPVPGTLVDVYRINGGAMIRALVGQAGTVLPTVLMLSLAILLAHVLAVLGRGLSIVTAKAFAGTTYSSLRVSGSEYPKFLAELVQDPVAKAHWEWELFLYYQRRNAAVSFIVWLTLWTYVRWSQWPPSGRDAVEYLVALLLTMGVYVSFVEGAKVMLRTHDLYASRFGLSLGAPALLQTTAHLVDESTEADSGGAA